MLAQNQIRIHHPRVHSGSFQRVVKYKKDELQEQYSCTSRVGKYFILSEVERITLAPATWPGGTGILDPNPKWMTEVSQWLHTLSQQASNTVCGSNSRSGFIVPHGSSVTAGFLPV